VDESWVKQLLLSAQRGDEDARNLLIRGNLGLVLYVARRFYRPGAFMELEDLVQSGCLGLISAIMKFDTQRSVRGKRIRFSTYAVYWIRHAISRAIENYGRTVAVPPEVQWQARSLERAIHAGNPQGRGAIRVHVLARGLGISQGQLAHVAGALKETVPLEMLSEEDEVLQRVLPASGPDLENPEYMCGERDRRDTLRRWIRRLPRRERYILEQNYGLLKNGIPRSLQAISRDLGICPERTRQLMWRAIRRIRRQNVAVSPTSMPSGPTWIPTIA